MKKEADELCDGKNKRLLKKNTIVKAKITLSNLFKENEKERWLLIWDDVKDLIPITKDLYKQQIKKIKESYKTELTIKWNLIENLKNNELTLKKQTENNFLI